MEINRGPERDFTTWAMIIQARDVLFRVRDSELSEYGITAVEARALFIVNLIGEQTTPAMIARWMLREHNTVTALLKRMENKGLITKVKDPNKRNSWIVGLTEKGREAYQNSLKRTAIHKILSVLTEEEKEVMISNLQKVCDETFKYLMEVFEKP
jgi:DNA-binding MarR family transcriptional regulator